MKSQLVIFDCGEIERQTNNIIISRNSYNLGLIVIPRELGTTVQGGMVIYNIPPMKPLSAIGDR
jgi:hypothetical protein